MKAFESPASVALTSPNKDTIDVQNAGSSTVAFAVNLPSKPLERPEPKSTNSYSSIKPIISTSPEVLFSSTKGEGSAFTTEIQHHSNTQEAVCEGACSADGEDMQRPASVEQIGASDCHLQASAEAVSQVKGSGLARLLAAKPDAAIQIDTPIHVPSAVEMISSDIGSLSDAELHHLLKMREGKPDLSMKLSVISEESEACNTSISIQSQESIADIDRRIDALTELERCFLAENLEATLRLSHMRSMLRSLKYRSLDTSSYLPNHKVQEILSFCNSCFASKGQLSNSDTMLVCVQAIKILKDYGVSGEDIAKEIRNSVAIMMQHKYAHNLLTYLANAIDAVSPFPGYFCEPLYNLSILNVLDHITSIGNDTIDDFASLRHQNMGLSL